MEGKEMEEEVMKDMTPRLVSDLGMRYPTKKSTKKARFGLYECAYCKKEFEAQTAHIKSGNTKSCGCQRGKPIHGLSSHRFYATWVDILQRCNNPQRKTYKHYGGRGITVCEEWLDVVVFVSWAEATHPNIKGYSLDRIDNDKGYSPENCRRADVTTQILNQRKRKDNTSGYTGVTWHKNVKRWCSTLKSQGVLINVGTFKDKIEAVLARDNYIIENNLTHKLSTEYVKEKK